jgi:hypothetical protein
MTISGTVTVSGIVSYDTGTLTCTSGTVTTSGSTLTIGASTTLNTSAISWNEIDFTADATVTINSILTATTIVMSGFSTLTFAGTSGFTVGTLTNNRVNVGTVTFVNTVTYTITTSFSSFTGRVGAITTYTSDHATNLAILTLNNGATCNCLSSFTRIDASNGRAIWTFNGTVTTCNNIYAFNDAYPPSAIIQSKAVGSY